MTWIAPSTAIEAARVTIRPVDHRDLPELLEVNGDAEVTRYLPYETWRSLADAEAWLERMEKLGETGTARQFVVARRCDSQVIGTLLLFRYEDASRRVELGYVLGRRHWRQGLMREAVAAACEYAFSRLNMRRIEAEVNPANRASCALLQRLGFVLEGRLRQRWFAKGAVYDTNIFGVLAEDWRARDRAR